MRSLVLHRVSGDRECLIHSLDDVNDVMKGSDLTNLLQRSWYKGTFKVRLFIAKDSRAHAMEVVSHLSSMKSGFSCFPDI